MKLFKWITWLLVTLGVFGGSYYLKKMPKVASAASSESEERIVTMAPSSGEVVIALGLEESLVGVSRYMRYPESVSAIPKIGGYLDVDLESIVRLKPSKVVLLKEQADLAKQLDQLNIKTVSIDHMSLDGIQQSIRQLGFEFGRDEDAEELVTQIGRAIQRAQVIGKEMSDLRVLISIGREAGQGRVGTLTAVGAKGYHQELLKVLGVKNAYTGIEAFPQLSQEHLLVMNPDVIVDLFNTADYESIGSEQILHDWSALQQINAVKSGNVHVIGGDVHFIPGPRFTQTLDRLSDIVESYEYE